MAETVQGVAVTRPTASLTSKRGGYRSQKLAGGDHSALGDALATLRLIEEMAAGDKNLFKAPLKGLEAPETMPATPGP